MTPLILVADDDETSRTLVTRVLSHAGFEVAEAADGQEAVDVFARRRPELVVLDVRMPRMDGFEATVAIRALPGGATVPILMLTALDDEVSIARAYDVGATDFATKPLNVLLLPPRVRYMLRAHRTLGELKRSEERLAEAQRHARLGHWDWDPATNAMWWSSVTSELLAVVQADGAPSRESFLRRLHADDRELASRAMEAAARGETEEGVDVRVVLPDGAIRHLHTTAVPHVEEDGRPARVSGTVQDISERKEAEQRIRFLAYYDGLTRLPNRTLFLNRLGLAMDGARRDKNSVAVFFLDLDQFKQINDSFGHSVGDRLLMEVAERLSKALRKTDCVARNEPEDDDQLVARLGGDEFLILATGITRAGDAARIARRVQDSLARPFELQGYEVFVTGSIGIGIFPHDGEDAETLLKNADMAMYQAKQAGRNQVHFYDHSLHEAAVRRLSLENRLRRALERDELVVHFQPIVDEPTRRIVGAEALVRWVHPELDLLPPAEFIEISEETGLIVPIGDWVLRTALAEARGWREGGHGELSISINLSARQFKERRLASQIREAVEQSGLSVHCVELEITESLLMYSTQDITRTLQTLREMGLGIVLDDFGTGYSSLSYLLKLPFSTVKMDRQFISEIGKDARSAALISSIVTMAAGLRLSLIAEGVETPEQAAELRRLGCRLMQGYLFGRPVPAAEFRALLERQASQGPPTPRNPPT